MQLLESTISNMASDWQLSTPSKTCVIYLNTCNGYTEFRDQVENIYSEENTAVIFDTDHEHRGMPQMMLNVD